MASLAEIQWRTLGLAESLQDVPAGRSIRAEIEAAKARPQAEDLELLEPIAEGGMGVVFRARQSSLERDVAAKCLKPGASTDAAVRLAHEARITGALEHPNIPPIHGLRFDEVGRPTVIMKRIEGVSYLTMLQQPDHSRWSRAPDDRIRFHIETLGAVCLALELAHDRGIAHRDIKPENIMLGPFGEVFLLDWGLATRIDQRPHGVVGTPAYMAPEMVHQQPVTAATDVYLVGASLFHALTGRPLHPGDRFIDVLQHILDAPPLTFGENIAPEIAEVCRRAVQPDPNDRYGSARALREAMQAALQQRAASALLRSAESRLAWLSDAPMDDRARRLAYAEVRAALSEADRLSPGHSDVARCLAATQRAMLTFEIDRQNLEAAEALLTDTNAPDLLARLRALRADRQRQTARHRALEALAADEDHRIGELARQIAIAAFALFVSLMAAVVHSMRLFVGHREMLALQATTIVMGAIILAPLWWRQQHNRRSRNLIGYVVASTVFLPLFTALGWRLDIPIVELLLLESFALGPLYAVAGLAFDVRILTGLVVVVGGVVFGLLVPPHAPLGVTVAQVGGVVAAAAALKWMPSPPALSETDKNPR